MVGVGVDIVDIGRFERSLTRTPALEGRLFADAERGRPPRSLAARFAAKEALIKVLGDAGGFRWHDVQVHSDSHGKPSLVVTGALRDALDARGVTGLHLSLSHDAGLACAFVVAESAPPVEGPGA
ncbi:MAG: holo-ACP synthase [Naasia sp.]